MRRAELEIRAVETTIVDLPSRRPHVFATTVMNQQAIVVVRVRTTDGLEGIGEGVTPGGPWWSGESAESIKGVIDRYMAPLLVGADALRGPALMDRVDGVVAANAFAKAAVEMALWDLAGKAAGRSIADLLGGLRRADLPITWAFGATPRDELQDELDSRLAEGFRAFKFKMGAEEPHDDARRMLAILEGLPPTDAVIVDLNASWTEVTAARWLPGLCEAGVTCVEQPLPHWALDGMARLERDLPVPVMADESVCTPQDALEAAYRFAAAVWSIKLPKAGGVRGARDVAAVADAAGVACFGGSTIETSIMAAASAQVYGTWRDLSGGCELFGPRLLEDEVVQEPLAYDGGRLRIPDGPGIGVALDEAKLQRYARR